MECDISSMYTQTQSGPVVNKDASGSDFFSKLDSLAIRPAIDFVKDTGANGRDILSSSNSLKRVASQGGIAKRLSDGKPWMETKPKRLRMDVHRVLPYATSQTEQETPLPCSSATSGSVMSMDIDMDSPPHEESRAFLSAKGFSTWVLIIINCPYLATEHHLKYLILLIVEG